MVKRAPCVPLTLVPALVLCACGGALQDRGARMGWSTTAPLEDVPVRGFDVVVERRDGSSVKGELVAVEHDRVVTPTSEIPSEDIKRVTVVLRSVPDGLPYALGVWAVLGAASTASHGYFASFSGPSWLAIGIPAAIVGSLDIKATVKEPSDFVRLAQYARYPQGRHGR